MGGRWRIYLFGGLRAEGDGRVITRFRTQKTGALLAYLAATCCAGARPRRPHLRDHLVELLWPEAELQAGRNSLSQALSSLRHQLEPPGVPAGTVLVADRESIRLSPNVVTTDLAEFDAALRAATGTRNDAERAQRLSQALDLYRGELLAGYHESWVLEQREGLAESYFQALSQLLALLERAGDLPRAVERARRGVLADPLREEPRRDLMRLYAAVGQRAAALRQYRELERLLQEELGVSPSASLRRLAQQIEEGECGDAVKTVSAAAPGTPSLSLPATHADNPTRLPTGTVTFLLADIEGSDALAGREGEACSAVTEECRAGLRRMLRQQGGGEVKETGTAFLVAFARVGDALAAAVACQQALATEPGSVVARGPGSRRAGAPPLRVRMALHTGDVELHKDEYQGLVLSRATKLLHAARGGQILCSEEAAILLRRVLRPRMGLLDLGVYRLRGVTTPERLFQVTYPGTARWELRPPHAEAVGLLPPQLTRFFGRREELAWLCDMLIPRAERGPAGSNPAPGRLVTLTGPGGGGKTRLALAVAGRLVRTWHGAVWFVSLADLSDARLIADAVRDALQLQRAWRSDPLEQVVAVLSRQPALLVLDNFEHLVAEGAPLVSTLLERLPMLTCLVTSRRRLDLIGEREFPVLPLPTPRSADRPEQLVQCPSVQLFVDRAQAVRPDFQVTPANAAAVAALCERLEGIPLAMELAAARVQVLTPAQMLAHLERRLDFLVNRQRNAAARHRTLRAALEWSYRLLPPDLQRFFRQLCVFRGGWTLEAARVVCAEGAPAASADLGAGEARFGGSGSERQRRGPDPGARADPTLDHLEQLRESSLVLVEDQGEKIRFRMLETLRDYAREQLAPDELADLEQRHLEYFLALAEEAEPHLTRAERNVWLERLDTEHDNLRAALARTQTAGSPGRRPPPVAHAALRLAGALWMFWYLRGHLREGRAWLEGALTQESVRTAARAKVLHQAGALAWQQGDYVAARPLLEESVGLWRELGDDAGLGFALVNRGLVARDQGELDAARSYLEESVAVSRKAGDLWALDWALQSLGTVASRQGDPAAARSFHEEGLAISRDRGDEWLIAWSLLNLGDTARLQGECAQAVALYKESLALFQKLENKQAIAYCLEGMAGVATQVGQSEQAARLFGASKALREAVAAHLPPADRAEHDRNVAASRAALGRAEFLSAWANGRALTLEQAVTYAVRVGLT